MHLLFVCGHLMAVTVIHGIDLHSTHSLAHTQRIVLREREILQTVNAKVTFVSHIGSEYTNVLTANWYGCPTEVSVSATGQQVIARYCTPTSDF